jgi:myo-inositol-1(or 4)-monophosphatase
MMWESELELARRAAKITGDRLRAERFSPHEILDNAGRDVKLLADREAEGDILNILASESEFPILTEETGLYGSVQDGRPVWIVDPLDGTLNYSRGLPLFCVSIGLWQGEQPLLGVVYDVAHYDLYSGAVDSGAWCNSLPIHVSKITEPSQAIIATGFPVNRDFESPSLRRFLTFLQVYKKVRLLGSAALSLVYLASGRVDVYFEEDIMLWDIAAGAAIVAAAGGYVTITPSPRKQWARTVICASSNALLAHINPISE